MRFLFVGLYENFDNYDWNEYSGRLVWTVGKCRRKVWFVLTFTHTCFGSFYDFEKMLLEELSLVVSEIKRNLDTLCIHYQQ